MDIPDIKTPIAIVLAVSVFFLEPFLSDFHMSNEIAEAEAPQIRALEASDYEFYEVLPAEEPAALIRKFLVTAYYAPLPDQDSYVTGFYVGDKILNGSGSATYSGKVPRVGYVAADLNLLPLGTELYIPGYGPGVVEDTGGRIKGNRLDVFMGYGDEGMTEALEWGARVLEVQIILVQ